MTENNTEKRNSHGKNINEPQNSGSRAMAEFAGGPVVSAVLRNTLPAMVAMLMVLVYNLADTFCVGQTHNDILVAAVSLATPVFLIFMALGTIFGAGGDLGNFPSLWSGAERLCREGLRLLYVVLCGAGAGAEGYHDYRYGLYRFWPGCTALAGVLRRGRALAAV